MFQLQSKLAGVACALVLGIGCAHANIEIYGHRGAAGLAPENTIPGYRTALMIGVDVIDLDVVLTSDDVVVVSHDTFVNPQFSRLESAWLKNKGPAVKDLSYKSLLNYDVGRVAPDSYYRQKFPYQLAFDKTRIPTLDEVITFVKEHQQTPIRYQIELKTTPHQNPESPDRQKLVEAVLKTLRKHKILEQSEIQSFDWQALLMFKKLAPGATLSFVTVESGDFNNVRAGEYGDKSWTAGYKLAQYDNSLPKMISSLGGSVWTVYYKNLTKKLVDEAHKYGLRVVPWSVDNEKDMARMVALNVDGIITNRPDILRGVLAAHGLSLPAPTNVSRN